MVLVVRFRLVAASPAETWTLTAVARRRRAPFRVAWVGLRSDNAPAVSECGRRLSSMVLLVVG
jgi:hypothetical protein